MSISDEISQVLEIKLAKYRNSGLSTEIMDRLTNMLIEESITETVLSKVTLGKISGYKQRK